MIAMISGGDGLLAFLSERYESFGEAMLFLEGVSLQKEGKEPPYLQLRVPPVHLVTSPLLATSTRQNLSISTRALTRQFPHLTHSFPLSFTQNPVFHPLPPTRKANEPCPGSAQKAEMNGAVAGSDSGSSSSRSSDNWSEGGSSSASSPERPRKERSSSEGERDLTRPSITIDTSDHAVHANNDTLQLYDSPTSLSDEDNVPSLCEFDLDAPRPKTRRPVRIPEAKGTIVPRIKVDPGPMSAPPASHYKRGPTVAATAFVDLPKPNNNHRPTFPPNSYHSQSTHNSNEMENRTRSSPPMVVTSPPTNDTYATKALTESNAQLISKLQAALEKDPAFFYSVKGLLHEFQERFGSPQHGWTVREAATVGDSAAGGTSVSSRVNTTVSSASVEGEGGFGASGIVNRGKAVVPEGFEPLRRERRPTAAELKSIGEHRPKFWHSATRKIDLKPPLRR
ncbi:hypothetical protein P7C70_g1961, partial [Phenoliferia sp. Uapishka_3]